MATVTNPRTTNKNDFAVISEAFLQSESLPFSKVLDADLIRETFRQENGLFAQENLFSTEVVLWAFLAQCLRDGKGAACTAAVNDITTYMVQTGQEPPSGDTGDYCRARAKLSLPALRRLVTEAAPTTAKQGQSILALARASRQAGGRLHLYHARYARESKCVSPERRPGAGGGFSHCAGVRGPLPGDGVRV